MVRRRDTAGLTPYMSVALSDLFSRRRKEHSESETGASDAPVHPTKVLARFIAGLSARSQPVLLDLGPVVGNQRQLFRRRAWLQDHRRGSLEGHRSPRARRRPRSVSRLSDEAVSSGDRQHRRHPVLGSVRLSGQEIRQVAGRSARADASARRRAAGVLRHGGAADRVRKPEYTRHVVVDRTNLQHRPYVAARPKQRPLPNRDIQRLFEPLRIVEQFLLKTNLREVLFRKAPEAPGATPVAPSA